MPAYIFNIRGAWTVADDQERDFSTLEEARAGASALIAQLAGDYPEAYWARLSWCLEISVPGGAVVSVIDA